MFLIEERRFATLWSMGIEFNSFFGQLNKAMKKDFIRAGIIAASSAALAACAWAQRNGLVDFTPAPTNNGGAATEVDPTLTATATQEIVKQEVLEVYGEYLIGESGLGTITELKLQENPNQADIDQIKSVALLQIPNSTTENLSVYIYDIVGENGVAPFVMVSKNDNENKLESAYVGFWVDEEGVQRPPINGNVYKFYPLMVYEQPDGSQLVGIPDATNQGMQFPNLFSISKEGLISFYPPFTDFSKSGNTRGVPVKVNALPIGMNIEAASEFIEINVISSVEYNRPNDLIKTTISIDSSFASKPQGIAVDEVVLNENFPRDPEQAMSEMSHHMIYKVAVETNPEAANLTFDEFINKWQQYKSGNIDAKKYVEITIFDDATQSEISIVPDNINYVFGTTSKFEGLHKFIKDKYDDGFRIEYHPDDNSVVILLGRATFIDNLTSYRHFASYLARSANLLILNKGDDFKNFDVSYMDKELLRFITQGDRVVFQIKNNGEPANGDEAKLNPLD